MKGNFADFQNCLRIQLTPDEYAEERIQDLLVHCKKFGFNSVIFLTAVYGIKGFRASCRIAAGDFVKIDYDGKVECLSNVYKADGSIKVNSFVKGKNFLVNPFVVDKKLYTQFSELRRYFISNFVEEKTNIILNSRFEGIYCYLYAKEKEALVMLVNSTIENFEKIEFYIKGVDFNKIVCIDKDGTNRNLTFNKVGDLITILEPFDYMSTKTIKLVKE